MARGILTEAVKDTGFRLMGEELTVRKLRLMPYIQYVMMNEQRTYRAKISDEERDILEEWQNKGYLVRDANFSLTITRKFWDIINEILWFAYVEQTD